MSIYKANKRPVNSFVKLSSAELEKYYESYMRILAEKECKYEPYNDMLEEYEEKIESDNSPRIAKIICKTHMFDEIAHRFFKIVHLSNGKYELPWD